MATDETKMSSDELVEATVQLVAAGQTIQRVDLDRLEARLQEMVARKDEASPEIYEATKEYVAHMLRLVKACRPVKAEMARAPGRRLDGGKDTLVA